MSMRTPERDEHVHQLINTPQRGATQTLTPDP
jgi:hypothetical protein